MHGNKKILGISFVILILLCLLPTQVSAKVTHFIATDYNGIYYRYNYESLLRSYALNILEAPSPLYDDYASKRVVSLFDDINGYVDYEDVLQAYAVSLLSDTPFEMNTYTSGSNAVPKEMPPVIFEVNLDESNLKLNEIITVAGEAKGPELSIITTESPEPVETLTTVHWTGETAAAEGAQYAWYIYRDGNPVDITWYTESMQLDYIPTEPGTYKVICWAVSAEGYSNILSDGLQVNSSVEIIKPDWDWLSPLVAITQPVEYLVQHHMAHGTWDVYDVHEYHKRRLYEEEEDLWDNWAGIGYNYWISFDGTIYQGRGRMKGAHSGPNWNYRTLGVGYQGHLDFQDMTDSQLHSGAWLNAKLIIEENLDPSKIIGHRDILSTTCPGKNFRMDELRQETYKILDAAGYKYTE